MKIWDSVYIYKVPYLITLMVSGVNVVTPNHRVTVACEATARYIKSILTTLIGKVLVAVGENGMGKIFALHLTYSQN